MRSCVFVATLRTFEQCGVAYALQQLASLIATSCGTAFEHAGMSRNFQSSLSEKRTQESVLSSTRERVLFLQRCCRPRTDEDVSGPTLPWTFFRLETLREVLLIQRKREVVARMTVEATHREPLRVLARERHSCRCRSRSF